MRKLYIFNFLIFFFTAFGIKNLNAQCAGTPSAGFTSPNDLTICESSGTPVMFSLVGNDDGPDFTFQWEISDDNGATWQSISGADANSYSPPATITAGFYLYRCKVTCTTTLDFDYSTPGQLTVLSPIQIDGFGINESCMGVCDGAIWIDLVIGGDGLYNFDPLVNGNIYASSLCTGNYSVTIYDNSGCTTSVSYDVFSPPPVIVDFTAGSICDGDVATLNANVTSGDGPFTFFWYPNINLSANNQQTVFANPNATVAYSVDVTDVHGCQVTASDVLTVNPLPSISITALNGGIINLGDSETLTASGGSIYSWTDGLNNLGTSPSITVSPFVGTTYYVYGTDFNGCTDSSSYFVNVVTGSGPLNIVPTITDVTCFGLSNGSVSLSVSGGVPPYSYSWSNGAQTQNVSGLAAGNYFVTVTDTASNSQVVPININSPAPITINTNYIINEVCGGSNGEISVFATGGTPGYSYTWSVGQFSNTLTNLPSGSYSLQVVDSNGCTMLEQYTISNTFISAKIHGTALLNGNFLNGGKAYLYEITDTTAYLVRDSAQLNSFGEFDFFVNQNANYLVMVKADAQQYPYVVPTFYGNTFKWNLADTISTLCGSGDTIGINLISYNPALSGNGLITGAVIDITDSTNQRRPGEPIRGIDIILEDMPGGNITARTVTDNNGEYVFSGVANGNYRLYLPIPGCFMINTYDLTINGFTSYINRDFYVDSLDGYIDTSTVVRMQSCVYVPQFTATAVCLGDTTRFVDMSLGVPTAISGYRWDFDGDGIVDDTTKGNVNFVYQTAGVFNASLTILTYDGVCSVSENLAVTVNDLPRVVVSPDTALCSGNPLTLTASGAASYSWVSDTSISSTSNNLAAINTASAFGKSFYVFGIDVNGCVNSDTADVTVYQSPNANFIIKNNNICFGNIAEFKDTSLNVVPGTVYAWDFDNDDIAEDFTAGSINYQYAAPGNYNIELLLISPNGCRDSILKPITIRNNPLIVSAGYDKSIICGASTPLQAYCNTPGVSYLWSPNYYLGNPFVSNTTATPDTTTHYVVRVSKDDCFAYDTVIVYVTPLTADAGLDRQIICSNSVTLNGTSNGVTGTLYQWTPGTGLSSQSILKPTASPNATTTYVLMAYKNTCVAYDTVTVYVDPIIISAGSDKTIICGQSTTLNATSPGASGLTWSWSPSQGLNNPSTANVTATPFVTTDYILTGFKGNCVSRDTVRVVVTPFNVYAGPDKTIDCGNSTQIQATSFYTSGATYNWFPTTGLSNTLSLTPTASPTNTTTYTLTVTRGNCVSTDTVTVNVNQDIPLSFSADKTIFSGKYPPYVVKFTNNTPNPNNYVFRWNFGDGSPILTARNYTYAYQSPGTFTVSLYAENLNGACKDTLTYVDYIVAWSPVAIPNELSVNYDVDIYPNPGNGMVTLSLNDVALKDGVVSILDISGKTIKWEIINLDAQNKMKIDLTELPKGVYFIKLENNKSLSVKRYVKE